MLEDIRIAVMKRIANKKAYVEKWTGNHGSFVMKKLHDNILESVTWEVVFNGDDGYEVKKCGNQFKLSLERRSCSCRAWDLSGIPCPHAICVIFNKGRQLEDYVDDCYSKDVYKQIYAHTIQPMNGELFWPRTEGDENFAPVPKKMTGRPKKKRKQEETENSQKSSKSSTHLSRKGRIMTCKICNQKGHNKRYCLNVATSSASVNVHGTTSGSSAAGTSVVRGRGRVAGTSALRRRRRAAKINALRGRGRTVGTSVMRGRGIATGMGRNNIDDTPARGN